MRRGVLILCVFFLCGCVESYYSLTSSNDAKTYLAECAYYLTHGKYDSAVASCTKAIELNPSYKGSYTLRGAAYLSKGEYDLAVRDFSKVIELDPKWDGGYVNRGQAYEGMGEYDLAIRDYSKAIELDPKDAYTYSKRGLAYGFKGEYDLAIKDCSRAIELSPKDHTAYNYRGILYAILGELKRAYRDLMKAIELCSGHPFCREAYTRYHLAFILHELGREDEALKQLQKAAKLDTKIMKKQGKYLLKPASEKTLSFYAREYLFAAQYLSAPREFLARAQRILESTKEATVVAAEETALPRTCVAPYPNRYLLAVFVSKYDDLPALGFVKNDKNLLLKLATCFLGVPKNHILVLDSPTLATFRRKSREFLSGIRKRDALVFFYYSGHGITDSRGRFYLLPKDASVKSEAELKETALSLSEMEKKLALAKGLKLAMIDACRVRTRWKPAVLMVKKVEKPNMAVLFATSLGRISAAEKRGGASAFLAALYRIASRGIGNLDFNDSGYVELSELIKPLTVQVKKLSPENQVPELRGVRNVPVFPVE